MPADRSDSIAEKTVAPDGDPTKECAGWSPRALYAVFKIAISIDQHGVPGGLRQIASRVRELGMRKVYLMGSKEYPFGAGSTFESQSGGGIERFTEGMAQHCSEYRVTIVTRRFPGNGSYESGNLRVVRVPWLRGRFLRNPTFNVAAFVWLRARRIDNAIIVAQGPVAIVLAALLFPGATIVARPAGNIFREPWPWLLRRTRWVYGWALRRAARVVFVGPREQSDFRRMFPIICGRDRRIFTGVDMGRFKPARAKDLDVLFAGRMIETKGIELLVEACKSIRGHVHFVGDGPLLEWAKRRARALSLSNATFYGRRSDVEKLFARAKVFVIPSVSEGMPNALLEAMASGCACVTSRLGLPFDDGVHLLECDREPESIAQTVNRVLIDEELRAALTCAARCVVRTRHSWETVVDEMLGGLA